MAGKIYKLRKLGEKDGPVVELTQFAADKMTRGVASLMPNMEQVNCL